MLAMRKPLNTIPANELGSLRIKENINHIPVDRSIQ
jgi:hypothetical protein